MPLRTYVKALVHDVVTERGGWGGLAEELHARCFRGTPRFTLVTGLACAHYILPGMLPSKVARDNMVYSELLSLLAAVLTGVIVSSEYLAPA